MLHTYKPSYQNILSRAPPCFGRHVKPLVPAVFADVSTPVSRTVDVRQAAGAKIIAESLQHDENILYRPHLVWEKSRKKKI
jgi:hypothetical protein